MSAPRRGQAALAIGAAGVVLTALWLWQGPALAAGLVGTDGGTLAEAFFTLLVFGPLIVLALAGGALTGIAAWLPGKAPGRAAGLGFGLGLGGLLLAAGLAAIAGAVRQGQSGGGGAMPLLGLIVVVVQGGTEELLFRGWLQPLVAARIGKGGAVLLVAAVFALLHALSGAVGPVALLNLILGGILFGLLAAYSGGIAGAAAAHIAYNAAEQLLLGLDPNPGVGSYGSIVDLDLVGAARWGGSADGLNASWAMTVALLALLVPLALRSRGGDVSEAAPA